jgi:hypothetical protein
VVQAGMKIVFTITLDEEHYNGYVKVLFLLPAICVQSAICV